MPYTKPDLLSLLNITETQLETRLLAADLEVDKSERTEEEYHALIDICQLFDSKQVAEGDWQTARELYVTRKLVSSTKNNASKTGSDAGKKGKTQKNIPAKPNLNSTSQPLIEHEHKSFNKMDANLSVIDLINLAKQQLGLSLTLKEVVAVLECAGLANEPFYTQAQANKFLIACRVLIQGENNNLAAGVQEATTKLETGLFELVREVTNERAKQVPSLVKQLYLQNVVMALAQEQDDIETFFMQIKDSILAGVQGKSPVQSVMYTQWMPTPLPESTTSSNPLPLTSENGTSID